MGNTTLDLLIQARADFGAAKSQLTGLHQFLQGLEQQSKGVGGLIDLKPDTIKNIEALNKALAKTGQAGKALSAIRLPEAKFRAAAAQVEAMRRNFEQLQKTDLGKLARDLAKAAGQDVTNPLSWQWNKMTRGMRMQDAMILRNAYRNALYQPGTGPAGGPHGGGPGGPGSPGGGRDWGAYGARFGSWLGSGIGGGLVRTGGAIGSLALGGGIMGALFTGYRENQQMLEGVDAIFKSIGGNTGGFQALKEQVADLGGALQMTGAEASKLAETFVRTSGAADNEALARAQGAGQFGRGLGMDPNASSQLFGRAGLIGVGNSRQSQRDFATLMGKTIADSGMFARSEQVMEGMVGQLERIAGTQGRTMSSAEMENFGATLSKILGDPALRGAGGKGVQEVAQRLGGPDTMDLAMLAYSELAGGDYGKMIEIAHADPSTPIREIKGFEGYQGDETKVDFVIPMIRRITKNMGLDPAQFAAEQYGISPEMYRRYEDIYEGRRNLKGNDKFKSWLKGMGLAPDTVQMSGIGTLSDIYANQGAGAGSAHINRLVSLANEYRSNGQLKDRKDLSDELKAAMDDTSGGPAKLQAVMAKIAGQVGAPLTEADLNRQTQADLINALGEVGGYVNELVVEIKSGLTPAIKSLADFIDMVTPDSKEQKQAKKRASVLKDLDDKRIAGWKEWGWLDDKGAMTDKFTDNPVTRAEYERIAVERKLGRYAPGASVGTTPASGGSSASGNPTWNVVPHTAPNSGVTSGSAATNAMAANAAAYGPAPAGSPISWRNNNPGNLRGQYFGATGSAGGFATYATPQAGWDAMERQLTRYYEGKTTGRPLQTIHDIISTYAPASENDVSSYANVVAKKLGVGIHDQLDWSDPTVRQQLMSAMATHEAGRATPYGSTLGREEIVAPATAPSEPVAIQPAVAPAAPPEVTPAVTPAAPVAIQVAGRAASATAQAPAAPVTVQPATAPAAPPEVTPAVAPAAPVAIDPATASRSTMGVTEGTRVGAISGGNDWRDVTDPEGQKKPGLLVHTITDEERAWRKENYEMMARDRQAQANGVRTFGINGPVNPAPPPTPDPVFSMSTPKSTDARVDGAVAININVAKDGKPVSETFRSLSFGEPRVPGSGGTLPKNNRVEWSHTV